MRVSVIGAGYVGLVSAAGFAKLGNEVTLIDIDAEKVVAINAGKSPIYEEGLDDILQEIRLEAGTDFSRAADGEVIFICVGTPSNADNSINLEQLKGASEAVAGMLKAKADYGVVCVKSTVPPGTTDSIVTPILEQSGKRAGRDFGVCMCPEFLREGKAVYDFLHPARVVIGEYDKHSGDILHDLYRVQGAPVFRTDLRTAEMIKLASNAFLATKISFINEIGNICKTLGIDTYDVAEGMGLDERIGRSFLNSGIGFGGSCLPKDLKMIIAGAREMGYEAAILKHILELNDIQAVKLVELLKKHVSLKGAVIGVLGLAFKPDTDDVRDSRAINIVQALLDGGARVKACDPMAEKNFRRLFPGIDYVSKEESLKADAVLIVTEWAEFNDLDYKGKIVIDGRRVPKAMEARIYEGVCW
ncbi:UDP-glucose dehydrogenase family protein [Chloroflexota bacterium]